jgi:hypothetical protein
VRKIRCTIFLLICVFSFQVCYCGQPVFKKARKVLEKNILIKANESLTLEPITITTARSQRSAGGLHDFFSEGDYWWPNPNEINGAYIQKDGLTNPQNFVDHRKAMIRFSQIVGTLTSAYLITKNEKYADHAFKHLRAWFIDTATLMNPSMLYAQAIKGKVTGRSIGIIDMIQMMEVAQSVAVLQNIKSVNKTDVEKIKDWFNRYLQWVTTHPYGTEERDAKNNHATCWVMQVAVFAKLVGNQALLDDCKVRFKTILLPNQMAEDGSFPLELKRTKPYGYSLFNLDAMATICQVLSNEKESLWDVTIKGYVGLQKGIAFMAPFVAKKQSWKYPADVMYFNDWPVAQPFLIFGYNRYYKKEWFELWKKLDHFPKNEEVIRNLPIRNPLIWLYGK